MILYVVSDRGAFAHRAGRKLLSICETWRDMGQEVELVCGGDVDLPDGGSPESTPAKNPRTGLTSTPDLSGLRAPFVHSLSEFRDMRHDRRLADALRKRAAERKPGLVWHRASRLHEAPMHVARELGVPYVLEWIDKLVSYDRSLFRSAAIAADHRRMQGAHRVVVTSRYWRRDVSEEFDIPLERILVSHNAVDPDEFVRDPAGGARVRERMNIPADALVVGFVGSYGWYHEAHLMAEAAAILRNRLEKPVYFLMVGDGPNRHQLDETASRLGVDDIVCRQGSVPQKEVPEWLSAMDAAVVPANGGEIVCPMKVPEYMSTQVAPVVADSAADREVVDERRTGLFFRTSDATSMADAIGELAAEPGLAARLGRAAREEVLERFSWRDTFGRALENVLASIEPGA